MRLKREAIGRDFATASVVPARRMQGFGPVARQIGSAMLDAWVAGVQGLLQVRELMFLGLGMAIGLVFGAMPGLGGATALALLMPLTYGLDPFTALALAGGVMGAVPMGGSITAILLNAPGTAPNAATCLDGYPLAQQGKAGYAIGAAASANSLGGIIGTVSVLAVLPVAKQLVLLFGPPEFFLLAILALITVAGSLARQDAARPPHRRRRPDDRYHRL